MAVLRSSIPQNEADAGFGLLKDIVALAKNPNLIAEAEEERRKQAALTEEELAKYAEARAFMAQYDAAIQKLDERQTATEEKERLFQQKVISSNEDHTKKHNELLEWEGRLAAIAAQHEETDKRHKQEQQDLEEERKRLKLEHEAAMAALADREEAVKKDEAANATEKATLADLKAKLDKRAENMKKAALED